MIINITTQWCLFISYEKKHSSKRVILFNKVFYSIERRENRNKKREYVQKNKKKDREAIRVYKVVGRNTTLVRE